MSAPAAVTMMLPRTATPPTASGRANGATTGMPSAGRHARTVRSSPPLTMTGVQSSSAPTATAHTAPVWLRAGPGPGRRRQPPHPHRVVVADADDDRGAVRVRPHRHRGHPAVVAAQRLPDLGGRPAATAAPSGAAAADHGRGAVRQRPDRQCGHRAGVADEDPVAGGYPAVGPAGSARAGLGRRSRMRALGAAANWWRSAQLAGPRRPVEGSEVVGA